MCCAKLDVKYMKDKKILSMLQMENNFQSKKVFLNADMRETKRLSFEGKILKKKILINRIP